MAGNDSFTKVLLHMDGANAGTSFTDSNLGGGAHTWTAHSATTSTTQIKFGSASMSCGAGAGYIDTPDSADFTLGASDFTIDCWFWVGGGAGAIRNLGGQINSSGTTGSMSFDAYLNSSNKLQFDLSNGTAIISVVGATAITTTGWHHAAFVRFGNVLKLFLDGVQEGGDVAFTGAANDSANALAVGRVGEFTTQVWNGFIDEFRISIGIARWTSNFTPPTSAYTNLYTLACAAASFTTTGVATILKSYRKLNPATASFALTGVSIPLRHVYRILAAAASFAVTGASLIVSDQVAPASKFALRLTSPTLSKLRTSDPTLDQ